MFIEGPTKKILIPWLVVRKWTIPTERPPLVSEVCANFCGKSVSRGQRNGSPRPLISVFKTGAATFSFSITLYIIVYIAKVGTNLPDKLAD
jgi:hypothetical protein